MENKWIIILMCVQLVLIITGVWQIKTGTINVGIFNLIVNSFAIAINLTTILK